MPRRKRNAALPVTVAALAVDEASGRFVEGPQSLLWRQPRHALPPPLEEGRHHALERIPDHGEDRVVPVRLPSLVGPQRVANGGRVRPRHGHVRDLQRVAHHVGGRLPGCRRVGHVARPPAPGARPTAPAFRLALPPSTVHPTGGGHGQLEATVITTVDVADSLADLDWQHGRVQDRSVRSAVIAKVRDHWRPLRDAETLLLHLP
mmetsp:Transcript_79610/g.213866  ORF Transcript_79610/g.213866 Transcript_79610/m.213866 type:complete len:205 (+) Transcript_79610:511-1125(+)